MLSDEPAELFVVLCPSNIQGHTTRWGGRMSRASVSRAGRSGNPKVAGSSLELEVLISDRVKPMTLKVILVAS